MKKYIFKNRAVEFWCFNYYLFNKACPRPGRGEIGEDFINLFHINTKNYANL